jgi:hypothetical protein
MIGAEGLEDGDTIYNMTPQVKKVKTIVKP